MEFADLWEKSGEFRRLFLSRKILRREEAEALWAERYPLIDWGLCPEPGCDKLVPGGAHCSRHVVEGDVLPEWTWSHNELFRRVRERFGHAREFVENQYQRYSRWLLEQRTGALPVGYDAYSAHPNSFVISPRNLFPLSHVSRHLVQGGVLTLAQGLSLDQHASGFINVAGRYHHAVAILRIDDIARATRLRPSSVRSAISRGELFMYDPASVLKYVVHKAGGPRNRRSPIRRIHEVGKATGRT